MELMFQVLFALVVVYSSFCRLVHTSHRTLVSIRWSLTCLAAAGMLLILAPALPDLQPQDFHWAPGETPSYVWLMFLAASAWVQSARAFSWNESAVMQ